MKTLLTTYFVILFSTISFAQKPDKVLARVKYSFIHIRDTTQKNNPYTENMLLVIGKNASVFTSLDRLERELDLPKAKRAPGSPFKPINQVDLYFFAKENKLMSRERFMNAYYLIDEPSQQINWKITKDTTSFNGVHCKKATATFKGRNWIAWYAPELPFQSGPWKLNGLPGLIIQANDDKKEVQFLFDGIDNLKKENLSAEQIELAKVYDKSFFFSTEIALQKDAKITARAEFDKIMDLFKKDPKGFIAAASGTPRDKVFIGGSMTGVSHTTINNPIELPEKK
ncbi:GLPGLI family protein [Pedobacter sp. LMG 31464]|uniref:GLPGLI family protein n=1 Tax=Pedobacter planticolens TaxID=2679964 RepID=A0A923IUS4_9SPHI|nr:GLPGLI family protein [Pedobacter planticolens]MBB2145186.1 GLPGLI family protein [Pedobacter planticolens]